MELIRIYTKRVSRYLPTSQRERVEEDLFQSLLEQFNQSDWREEAGGERLFLQEQPHPIRKATELSEPSHLMLIGPTYYLSFIEALKIAALILAVIWTGLFALLALTSDNLWRTTWVIWLEYPDTLLKVYLIIAMVFVVMEKTGKPNDWLGKWNAKSLREEISGQRVSLKEAIIEINISVLGLLLLSGALNFTTGFSVFFEQRDIWVLEAHRAFSDTLLWMLILLLSIDLITAVVKMALHHWNGALRAATVAVNLAWIGTLAVLLAQDGIMTFSPRAPLNDLTELSAGINLGLDIGLIVIMIIVAWETVTHMHQLSREHPVHWQHN